MLDLYEGPVATAPRTRTGAPDFRATPTTLSPPRPAESTTQWRNPHEAAAGAEYWLDLLRAMDGDDGAQRAAVWKLAMVDDRVALTELANSGSALAATKLREMIALDASSGAEAEVRRLTDGWMRASGIR